VLHAKLQHLKNQIYHAFKKVFFGKIFTFSDSHVWSLFFELVDECLPDRSCSNKDVFKTLQMMRLDIQALGEESKQRWSQEKRSRLEN
jgi:hypothetical protein